MDAETGVGNPQEVEATGNIGHDQRAAGPQVSTSQTLPGSLKIWTAPATFRTPWSHPFPLPGTKVRISSFSTNLEALSPFYMAIVKAICAEFIPSDKVCKTSSQSS